MWGWWWWVDCKNGNDYVANMSKEVSARSSDNESKRYQTNDVDAPFKSDSKKETTFAKVCGQNEGNLYKASDNGMITLFVG